MRDLGKTFTGTDAGCRYGVSFNWTSGEHTGYFTNALPEALADYTGALCQAELATARIQDRWAIDDHGDFLTIYRHGEDQVLTRRMRQRLALAQPLYPEWGTNGAI